MNQYQHRSSRSASQPRTGSHSRSIQINPFTIVQLINSGLSGQMNLRQIRNNLFPNVDPRSNIKFQELGRLFTENNHNFVLSPPLKDPYQVPNGNETVWVRTVLGLCDTHCRLGKDRRNRACDGECGSLHVCRTFLLHTDNVCPFNSKGKKCMFGHNFATEHNVELLKTHNLYGLHSEELQRLFRRRPSRTASTLPQVCIYYNKPNGKVCSRENCKSLHLCLDFIQQRCIGVCSRNHKLSTPQVTRVLDLFAFDRTWTPEMLLEDLRHFLTPRHTNIAGSNNDSDDSDGSEFSEPGGSRMFNAGGGFSSSENLVPSSPPIGNMLTCGGCEDLKREVKRIQLIISNLSSQVMVLTNVVEDLKKSNTNSSRSSNQQAAATGQDEFNNLLLRGEDKDALDYQNTENALALNELSLQANETEPKFIRSQSTANCRGIPPHSLQSEPKLYIDNSD